MAQKNAISPNIVVYNPYPTVVPKSGDTYSLDGTKDITITGIEDTPTDHQLSVDFGSGMGQPQQMAPVVPSGNWSATWPANTVSGTRMMLFANGAFDNQQSWQYFTIPVRAEAPHSPESTKLKLTLLGDQHSSHPTVKLGGNFQLLVTPSPVGSYQFTNGVTANGFGVSCERMEFATQNGLIFPTLLFASKDAYLFEFKIPPESEWPLESKYLQVSVVVNQAPPAPKAKLYLKIV